jgi:hypothetical protein
MIEMLFFFRTSFAYFVVVLKIFDYHIFHVFVLHIDFELNYFQYTCIYMCVSSPRVLVRHTTYDETFSHYCS